jgi:hypothetical protein
MDKRYFDCSTVKVMTVALEDEGLEKEGYRAVSDSRNMVKQHKPFELAYNIN